ncbi:hypothetical protein AB0395_21780 [Streptosporangium sp. NPDC051023]|uniref:hypothetical protein n=1 Tax=Streptosporangium sp. NPDC051023 TaxID=3155410 RepID=UPI00344E8868
MVNIQELFIQAAIGAVPLGVAYLAYRSSTDANRRSQETAQAAAERQAAMERTKVDSEAFERARVIYEDALSQLEKQLDRLQSQFDRVNEQLSREQDASNTMRVEVWGLRTNVATLERLVATLRRQLIAHGLIPEATHGPDSTTPAIDSVKGEAGEGNAC